MGTPTMKLIATRSVIVAMTWLSLSQTHARADVSGTPPAASAQAVTDEPQGYRELVDEALGEYDLKNYQEALALFTRAHELFPNARTFRGMGKAQFELRNYRTCIELLEASLRSTVRPLDASLRADVEQLLGRARNFLGELSIETIPPAEEVRVDDQPVALPPGRPLVLEIGEHVIEVGASGYLPEKRRISVTGRQVEKLTVVFARPASVPKEQQQPQSKRRWYRSPWLWTAVGAAVAGAAAGTAVAATRDSGRAPYDRGTSDTLGQAP